MGIDNEQSFMACVLNKPDIIFKTTLREDQFLDGDSRRLFRACMACADKKIAIDYISIHEVAPELPVAYVMQVHDMAPSGANWPFFEKLIKQDFQREKLQQLGRVLREVEGDPAEYIERAERELLSLAVDTNTTTIEPLQKIIVPTLQKIEERYHNRGKLPGLSTGLDKLDGFIGGLQESRYYVIGARPSDGKSALAVNMVCHIGLREESPVGLISAESSNTEICTRIFSSEGHINGQKISSGALGASDFQSLQQAGEKMYEAPIYLYDAPNIEFSEAKSIARQMVAVYKIKALFVDYLQIIQWADQRLQKREQIAGISLGLKQLARELKIPVVALAQLRRDAEGREPEMADLAESSQVEKDADGIILIYHPKPSKEGAEPPGSMLLIKKNRDGPRGAVFVNFQREYVRFYEAQRD